MNLQYYYWWFKSALPPRICNEIVKYGLQHEDNMALTGSFGHERNLQEQPLNKKEIKDLKKKRNSNIAWSPVSLRNISQVNITIGIVIVGKECMKKKVLPRVR